MDVLAGSQRRDASLATIRSDLLELQNALDAIRRQSTTVIERQIVEQPFQSIGIAFAAGFVFSRLLSSRLF
jgi:ElaB/YqjD/DUF883 family membrane-anchored ribosome-binding protein